MAIDPMEVSLMELRDFGEPVSVLPPRAAAFVTSMIFDDGVENTGLGQFGGHLGQPTFRCLPADASAIVIDSLISLGSSGYKVVELIRRRHCLTEIRVLEQ